MLSATRITGHIFLRDYNLTLIHNTISHYFGQSIQLRQKICLFSSKALQQLKLQTCFQYLLYMWIKTTQWTKMQVPPLSHPRQIRIVELLLYLPSCKMVQVLSDARDHLQNCTNTNSIQSHHFHIHVLVKLSL